MPYAFLIAFLILPFIASEKAFAEKPAAQSTAQTDARSPIYGTWGTAKQCAREPLKEGGSVLAQPYEISSQWLKQGNLFCSLNWGATDTLKDGLATGADVQCGEDSLRGYFLGLTLAGEELTVRWDFLRVVGPLRRCAKS